MPNEITLTANLQFVKGGVSVGKQSGSVSQDVTGADYGALTVVVTNSKAAFALPASIGTPGYIWIKNLDSTNTITIFPDGSGPATVKIRPGGIAMFELAASAPQAQTSAGTATMEYLLIEA